MVLCRLKESRYDTLALLKGTGWVLLFKPALEEVIPPVGSRKVDDGLTRLASIRFSIEPTAIPVRKVLRCRFNPH